MPSLFGKKEVFTIITPIPGFIPRQLALDILHSHSEVITLNPLVTDHRAIQAPSNAAADEYYSTWYEITEKIQFVPGMGKMGSGNIKFNGCFHNMPWGLQTHIYAPMNVDLRNKYRIAGNQPGFEPPEVIEMGLKALGAPSEGLYLQEDIEIKCNLTMVSFVKSQLQKAGGEMVKRIIKKAELLDAGVLQGMMENGKLKTFNPADRSSTIKSPLPSPTQLHHTPSVSMQQGPPSLHHSPTFPSNTPPPPGSPAVPYHVPRPTSYQGYRPNTPGSQYGGSQYGGSQYGAPYGGHPQQAPTPLSHEQQGYHSSMPAEMPAQEVHGGQNSFAFEMPGDYYFPSSQPAPLAPGQQQQQQQQQPPHQQQPPPPGSAPGAQPPHSSPPRRAPSSANPRDSSASGGSDGHSRFSADPSQTQRYTLTDSRPPSVSSLSNQKNGFPSPPLENKGFSSELATHMEEVNEQRGEALRKLDPRIPQPSHQQPYNPADYDKIAEQHKQAQGAYGQQAQRYQYSQ